MVVALLLDFPIFEEGREIAAKRKKVAAVGDRESKLKATRGRGGPARWEVDF